MVAILDSSIFYDLFHAFPFHANGGNPQDRIIVERSKLGPCRRDKLTEQLREPTGPLNEFEEVLKRCGSELGEVKNAFNGTRIE